jgi:Tetracyclin repressor-like, C-terminal domain
VWRLVPSWLVRRTGALLERSCPFLAAEAGGAALLPRVHALAIGIAQLADPPPPVQAVLGEPGMEAFRVEAWPMLETTLAALLVGLAQTRSRRCAAPPCGDGTRW